MGANASSRLTEEVRTFTGGLHLANSCNGISKLTSSASPARGKRRFTFCDDGDGEEIFSQSEATTRSDCSDSEGEADATPASAVDALAPLLTPVDARQEHDLVPNTGPQQESDLLETMPCLAAHEHAADARTQHIMLVSLGGYCGPKLSFQAVGRGAATLPFDWMRTRLEAVLSFLRGDFEGFFDVVESEAIPGLSGKIAHRAQSHSFWHDDPSDPCMQETYRRRMARLRTISAREQPVLFVRAAGDSEEVLAAGELLGELKEQFGQQARLLLILDCQSAASLSSVEECPDLLVGHISSGVATPAPYADHVCSALLWAAGHSAELLAEQRLASCPDLAAARRAACTYDSGKNGLGGIAAFAEAGREA